MNTAVGADDIAHFADGEGIGSLLERLLHLTWSELSQIPAFLVR